MTEIPEESSVLEAARPAAVARTLLLLTWLRSTGAVMRALAEQFPTQESWEAVMNEPELHEEIAAFQSVLTDVRSQVGSGQPTVETLERAGAAHYDRALDSVALTAERLGVDPGDLLVVLMQA